MTRRADADGYVEDSEGEEIAFDLRPPLARDLSGLPAPPQLPQQVQTMDTTVSSIQTADFTTIPTGGPHRPRSAPLKDQRNTTASSIQSADFTAVDRSAVSDISSFGPNTTRVPSSSIQSLQPVQNATGSSISISTSAAPRPKPRPRPVFKRKELFTEDTSISNGTPSSAGPSSTNVSFPSFRAMPPPPVPLPSSAAPSSISRSPTHTATTVLASNGMTQRVSDSGIDMMETEMMDIAERAKLRSRARSQAKGKQTTVALGDDVIELSSSSSDDELSFLSPNLKPKPKPKTKKTAAQKHTAAEKSLGKSKTNPRNPSKPSPSKRSKTVHVPESGFESDINTIPVPTSDFPIPVNPPAHLHRPSSQLPPSDPLPPPSTSGSSAHSAPPTSQGPGSRRDEDAPRHESPLSSPPPPLPRKRKRPLTVRPVGIGDDSDFATDEDSILPGIKAAMVPVVEIPRLQKKRSKEKTAPPPPAPSPDIVPETQPMAPPAKAKPASRRKRKDADGDEEWGGEPVEKPSKARKRARVDEEDEEEWAGDGPSKAKGKGRKKGAVKPKAPPKAKALKGKATAKGKTAASSEVLPDTSVEQKGDKDKDREVMAPASVTAASARKDKDLPPPTADIPSVPEEPATAPASKRGKGKQRAVVLSEDEDDRAHAADVSTNTVSADLDSPAPPVQKKSGRKSTGGVKGSKENDAPDPSPPHPSGASSSSSAAAKPITTPAPARTSFAHANRTYTISSKNTKSTPMSELIRRVSSLPGSPFPASARPTYSPLAKASKSVLRRIAPLHPNRRTPPPPPPRPPPPKKSKKMLEMEERWEMELEESMEGWYAMSEEERAALRRQKRDHELGFED